MVRHADKNGDGGGDGGGGGGLPQSAIEEGLKMRPRFRLEQVEAGVANLVSSLYLESVGW
jgi:hypothetical protein